MKRFGQRVNVHLNNKSCIMYACSWYSWVASCMHIVGRYLSTASSTHLGGTVMAVGDGGCMDNEELELLDELLPLLFWWRFLKKKKTHWFDLFPHIFSISIIMEYNTCQSHWLEWLFSWCDRRSFGYLGVLKGLGSVDARIDSFSRRVGRFCSHACNYLFSFIFQSRSPSLPLQQKKVNHFFRIMAENKFEPWY